MAYVSKNLTNPFDRIERIPEDEAEQRALMNSAFDYALDYIGEQVSKFQTVTKNKNETALLMTLAWLWVENRQMFKFVREKRIDLEDRVAALEARPPVPWQGVWDAEKQFTRNSFCSDRGAMWFAMADSKGVRPGSGDGVWKLCVKAGKDGKDAHERR